MKIADISMKWKIVAITAVTPIVIASILAFQRVSDIRSSAEAEVLAKSRAIVMMAESARNEMAHKLKKGVVKPFDEISSESLMQAVPVITAIQIAAENAQAGGYEFRVPKENPRNPKNAPTDFERGILEEMKRGNLSEKIVYEPDRIRYFKPIRLTEDCMICHGDPRGASDPVGGTKEGWKTGEIHGAFEIISSLEAANRAVRGARISIVLWTGGVLAVLLGLVWLMLRRALMRPLSLVMDQMAAVSNGDMTREVELARQDEFGLLVGRLNQMTQSLRNMVRDILSTGTGLLDASGTLITISDVMSAHAQDTSMRSGSVAAAAEEMSSNMNSVAAAVEETSTNVSMLAEAAEQMTHTINEISENTEKARSITTAAVKDAEDASSQVDELGKAALEIEKVTETITSISEQTNLLALNATIEAARAGDAGKGFAVVANEIKELAQQTVNATNEIRNRIEGIQTSTNATVRQIGNILSVIHDINEIVSTIATAVEEQSATTREIANNVVQASQGVQEVTENVAQASTASSEVARDIAEVSMGASEIADNSVQVKKSSETLSGMAEKLQDMVKQFRI